jgi:aspartate kinase
MDGLIVQKHSVSAGDVRGMQHVWRRIKRAVDAGHRVVAVISAMGQDTDRLVALAIRIKGGMPKPAARELDMLMASGEAITAPLVAIGLQGLGVPAVAFSGPQAGIRTNAVHGNAEITAVHPDRVVRALQEGRVAVVAGFQGATDDQDVTTLGRAGGDTTAVRLAAALGVAVCEIYVAYRGIRTADPYVVPEARVLSHLSYDEALELAATGLHMPQPRAVEIAQQYRIGIHLRPARDDAGDGTRIVEVLPDQERRPVSAIAHQHGLGRVRVAYVPNQPGGAADILEPLGGLGISVEVVNHAGPGDLSFMVRESDLDRALQAVEPAARALGSAATSASDLVKVSAVGAGMVGESGLGVAARMFRTLADAGINIETIASSDIRITCVIKRAGHERAVRALHSAFGLDHP